MSRDPFGWIGEVLDGRYRIEALAGEGSFGVVYRAFHIAFGEPVAVKCLKVAGVAADQRDLIVSAFRAEAKLLLKLSRETTGIVQAHDVGAITSPSGLWCAYLV